MADKNYLHFSVCGTMAPPPPSDPPRQVAADATLTEALQSNVSLQKAITVELALIASKKADNRRASARLSREQQALWKVANQVSLPPVPPNPCRPWKRLYFVSKDNDSVPEPNADTLHRRALQAKTFLHHLQPPWNSKETKALQAVVKEHQHQQQSEAAAKNTASEIDFDQVAKLLNAKLGRTADNVVEQPRTLQECKLRYSSLVKQTLPFSKDESRAISEQLHLHDGDPDWQAVAESLPNPRTAWECLVAYQTNLRPVVQQDWTAQEDQLLLQYIGAAGPQLVIDGNSIMHFAARIIPNKSRLQILNRINQSIFNPNLIVGPWSDEEERRLAICMKVYSQVTGGNCMYRASVHLPQRTNRLVAEKWHRSLNPEYSVKPFTPAEDEMLLREARADPQVGWTELARQFLPHRHPQRVNARWSELATDEDILARSGGRSIFRRGRVTAPTDGTATAVAVEEGARLELDDFVVQVRKKRKQV